MRQNIYTHIAHNNWKIIALVAFFPIALCLFVYAGFWLLATGNDQNVYSNTMMLFWDIMPWLIGLCVLFSILSILFGDKMMMRFAGAQLCPEDKTHLPIYHAVENVALAAGLPTPKVYLIQDDSLNAFATGFAPATASIALTTGIVKKLKPLELDAVIAHEMAHIKNRDIRLNMYIITGIGIIGMMGEILIRVFSHSNHRSRNSKGSDPFALLVLVGFLLLLFRWLIAPFIHMAISRKQEFQADATGAYFTRNPEALASALEKIALDPQVEALENSKQMASVCIYNPLKHLSGLLDTHPPVKERIKRLREMV